MMVQTVNVSHNIGGVASDSLTNIEGIKGSTTASNTLIGNNMNNTLIGGDQTDTIKGVSGNNSFKWWELEMIQYLQERVAIQ